MHKTNEKAVTSALVSTTPVVSAPSVVFSASATAAAQSHVPASYSANGITPYAPTTASTQSSAQPNDSKRGAEEQRILDDITLRAKKIDSEPLTVAKLSKYLNIKTLDKSGCFDAANILNADTIRRVQYIYTRLVQEKTISTLNRPKIVSLGDAIITESNRICVDHYFQDYWGPCNPTVVDNGIDIKISLIQLIIANNILEKIPTEKNHNNIDPALTMGVKAMIIAFCCEELVRFIEMGGTFADYELIKKHDTAYQSEFNKVRADVPMAANVRVVEPEAPAQPAFMPYYQNEFNIIRTGQAERAHARGAALAQIAGGSGAVIAGLARDVEANAQWQDAILQELMGGIDEFAQQSAYERDLHEAIRRSLG